MSSWDSVLFTAGHGFYQFAVTRPTFDRSLFYNLLLQPSLAIPDHYLLQGSWMGAHLADYPSRDSWVEVGLRNGFIKPYFRAEGTLLGILRLMEGADRRGFSRDATEIAERLDRTPYSTQLWSSPDNSALFGRSLTKFLTEDEPPMLEMSVDPDDFSGFWGRSREWVEGELASSIERSSATLGTEGLLLSKMIQVSGERLLGSDCGRITSVDNLLSRARSEVSEAAERDLRAYYTLASEIYNRSLADIVQIAPNSPQWTPHIAAMDLWKAELLNGSTMDGSVAPRVDGIDLQIRLPRPKHLRSVSGDALLAVRRSASAERYFESLSHWRSNPASEPLQAELVESLHRYAQDIRKQVGKDVGSLGLTPQFISRATDVSRVLEKAPGVVQGFLAVGASASAGVAALSGSSPLVPAAMFSLFVLQSVARHHAPSERVKLHVTPRQGLRVHPDISISQA